MEKKMDLLWGNNPLGKAIHSVNEDFNGEIELEKIESDMILHTIQYHLNNEMYYMKPLFPIKNIDELTNLDDDDAVIILRYLRHHLERKIWAEIPEDLFIAIIKMLPHQQPSHPYGSYSLMGYVSPLRKLLREYGWKDDYTFAMCIYSFFRHGIR